MPTVLMFAFSMRTCNVFASVDSSTQSAWVKWTIGPVPKIAELTFGGENEPAGPDGPCRPCGPDGPDGPDGPAAPAAPAGPEGPEGPCRPWLPCGPDGPDGPAAPGALDPK